MFRQELADGKTLDDLLVPAFATVREAAKRTLGQRHFDVQLIGGMVLHEGSIAEMKTGEGKTLVATLPVYLNALAGRGVHVVTVNDYLARRDAEWMGRIYQFLGLTVGVIVHGLDARPAAPGLRRRRDLRHQQRVRLRLSARQHGVQPAERWCSAGTITRSSTRSTSILVDEARTPLIISGPTEDRSELYITIDTLIPQLGAGDFEIDEKVRSANFTEEGTEKVEEHPARLPSLLQGRVALRRRERRHRPSPEQRAPRPQALPARQGLHRQERPGHHHRRVHRPHDGRPALFGRAAPGARGEGARQDPAGEPDARLDHLPELFPPLREARRHDRHGRDRGRRVLQHLQPRRGRGADQRADGPRRRGRRGLPHGRGEVQGDHRADQRVPASAASRCWSARPRSRSRSILAERLRKRGWKQLDFSDPNAVAAMVQRQRQPTRRCSPS